MRIEQLAQRINDKLRTKGLTLSTAESCTGGGIAAAITSIPGSSDIFKGGIVAYANEAKRSVLSVQETTLQHDGAVSEATVRQMAVGVARLMQTECAIATSGIAGPGGGTTEKPVGTVWLAVLVSGETHTHLLKLDDKGRNANIKETIQRALETLLTLLDDN
jgi:PncC family amidohydrolase